VDDVLRRVEAALTPVGPDRAANRVLATGFSLPPALRLAANVENLAVRDDELIGGLIALPVRW